MFQIVPAFAVPFVEVLNPQGETLNPQLRDLFLRMESAGDTYRNPATSMRINSGLFESNFTVFASPEPCIDQLREFCWGALSRAIAQLSGYSAAQMENIEIRSHTWFHVTRKGGYFGIHNHPMASWSGVYCVDPGEDDSTVPDSGALHFLNPMQLASMFADPANIRIRQPYSMTGKTYRLQAGQLVLFPSWVSHEVLPFQGNGTRITVAFNCWFENAGEST